jgi:hypothetical protein
MHEGSKETKVAKTGFFKKKLRVFVTTSCLREKPSFWRRRYACA